MLDFHDDENDAVVIARKVPSSPEAPLNEKGSTSLEKTGPITKGKSRKWAAQPKDGASSVDVSSANEQVRVRTLPDAPALGVISEGEHGSLLREHTKIRSAEFVALPPPG